MPAIDVYWEAIGMVGLEHLVLKSAADGISADGLVLRYHRGVGIRLRYRLLCDPDWKPRELSVETLGETTNRLSISADGKGNWADADGQPLDFLKGCVDVDIMATPFTNTLAVKHLGVAVGESKETEVVYVTIPELQLQRSLQRYTCLTQDAETSRYLYESVDVGFQAELSLDADQLVLAYQGVWERLR